MTVSTKYYDALINNEKTSLTKLKAERKAWLAKYELAQSTRSDD